jgi:hypothetical protein
LATALPAQTAKIDDFSAINEPRARVDAVRAVCKQLAGRTDPAAIAQWDRIHLSCKVLLERRPPLRRQNSWLYGY